MRVKILHFGSNWWSRFGANASDPYRFSRHAAYFNSTGVRCGRKMRRHWTLPGLIRFNGVGDFNPHFQSRAIGNTFCCTDLTFAFGGNRVLFKQKIRNAQPPDYYQVVVSSEQFGAFDFRSPAWKSASAQAVAISALGDRQEAMLLMKPGDWVESNLGFWQLTVRQDLLHGAGLVLMEGQDLGAGDLV
jgi:hypothetical protein